MYESFYGLSQRPFASAPVANRYFPASSVDAARQTLSRCIDRAEGVGLLIGPPGSGKTLLLQVLADQFSERFAVALLAAGQIASRRELLQAILFELKLPYQGLDEGELHLALLERLTRGEKPAPGLLLLVDEAQTLSPLLLEELRMITNLVRDGEAQARLVLAGGMSLEEHLANPQLASFSQRLAARCYLESFDRAETTDYIRFQVAVAGGQAESVFNAEAIEAVYRATDGIPRLVNQICDHALLLAYERGQRPIGASAIEEAWADLQQLPAPWQETGRAGALDEVVEFGSLDDDEEEDEAHETAGANDALVEDFTAPAGCPSPTPDETGDEGAASKIDADAEQHEATAPRVNGSARPTETMLKTELRFEEISQHVEALHDERPDSEADRVESQARPAAQEPTAETFDIQFEEEEVLIDPYAALDSQSQGHAATDSAESAVSRQPAAHESQSEELETPSPDPAEETAEVIEPGDETADTSRTFGVVADEAPAEANFCEELHLTSMYEKVEFVVNPYDGLDRPFEDASTETPPAGFSSVENVDAPRLELSGAGPQNDHEEEVVSDPYAMLDEQINQNLAAWDMPPGECEAPGAESEAASTVTPFSFKPVDDDRVTLAEAMRQRERPEADSPANEAAIGPRLATPADDEAESDEADWSLEIAEDQLDVADGSEADEAGEKQRTETSEPASDELIVVENDPADEAVAQSPSQVMRQDYRELFAKLRGS